MVDRVRPKAASRRQRRRRHDGRPSVRVWHGCEALLRRPGRRPPSRDVIHHPRHPRLLDCCATRSGISIREWVIIVERTKRLYNLDTSERGNKELESLGEYPFMLCWRSLLSVIPEIRRFYSRIGAKEVRLFVREKFRTRIVLKSFDNYYVGLLIVRATRLIACREIETRGQEERYDVREKWLWVLRWQIEGLIFSKCDLISRLWSAT